MTLDYRAKAARKKSVWGHNTGTTTEVVYVCPPNSTAEITFLHIANGATAGNNTVSVEWYVSADDYTSHFLSAKAITHSEYVSFPQIDLILQPGDKIQVTPLNAGHIDTILTVTELFSPVG